jgi:hypothetical protein
MSATTIDEILIADEPARWSALGFQVGEDCLCTIGSVRLRFTGESSQRGIVGWSLREIVSAELDGLPTERSRSPMPDPDQAPAHPNGIVALDHVVVMSPTLDRTVGALQAAGLELRRIREEPTPAGAPRQAFFRLGAEILEVVQIPDSALERAGGADASARFWGLAALAEDLERTVACMEGGVSPIRAAVQPGRRIATLKREAGLTVPLALMSPDERPPRGRS